ncbi:MAG: DUF721 domain-containing protein [Bacteroidales bacterium]|nr:DUF721 domain-containing protein [Bacteroidales bacterium]
MKEPDYKLSGWLKQAFKTINMDDTATEIEVRDAYSRLVGDLIMKLTWEINFDKGVLRVKLASAALRQELTLRRESLQQKLNETLGRNAVKQIVFQ